MPGGGLQRDFAALIDALVAAHLLEPELHRILEEEFPSFHLPLLVPLRQRFYEAVRSVLIKHRDSLTTPDIDVAAFVVMCMLKSLINAVVSIAPPGLNAVSVRSEILPAVIGYLTTKR